MDSWFILLTVLKISSSDYQGHVYHDIRAAHFHMQDQSPAIELHATLDGVHIMTRPASLDVSSKLPQSHDHRNRYRSRDYEENYRQSGRYGSRIGSSYKDGHKGRDRYGGNNIGDRYGLGSRIPAKHERDAQRYMNWHSPGDWTKGSEDYWNFDKDKHEGSLGGKWNDQDGESEADVGDPDRDNVDKRREHSAPPQQTVAGGADIHATPPIRTHPIEPIKFDGNMLNTLQLFKYGPDIGGQRKHSVKYLHHRHRWAPWPHIRHKHHMNLLYMHSPLMHQRFLDQHAQLVDNPGLRSPIAILPFPVEEESQQATDKITVSPFLPHMFADRMKGVRPLMETFYQSSVAFPFLSSEAESINGIRHNFQQRLSDYNQFPAVASRRQLLASSRNKFRPNEIYPKSVAFLSRSYQPEFSFEHGGNWNNRIERILKGFPYEDREEHFSCSLPNCFGRGNHEEGGDDREMNEDDDDDVDEQSDDVDR